MSDFKTTSLLQTWPTTSENGDIFPEVFSEASFFGQGQFWRVLIVHIPARDAYDGFPRIHDRLQKELQMLWRLGASTRVRNSNTSDNFFPPFGSRHHTHTHTHTHTHRERITHTHWYNTAREEPPRFLLFPNGGLSDAGRRWRCRCQCGSAVMVLTQRLELWRCFALRTSPTKCLSQRAHQTAPKLRSLVEAVTAEETQLLANAEDESVGKLVDGPVSPEAMISISFYVVTPPRQQQRANPKRLWMEQRVGSFKHLTG